MQSSVVFFFCARITCQFCCNGAFYLCIGFDDNIIRNSGSTSSDLKTAICVSIGVDLLYVLCVVNPLLFMQFQTSL